MPSLPVEQAELRACHVRPGEIRVRRRPVPDRRVEGARKHRLEGSVTRAWVTVSVSGVAKRVVWWAASTSSEVFSTAHHSSERVNAVPGFTEPRGEATSHRRATPSQLRHSRRRLRTRRSTGLSVGNGAVRQPGVASQHLLRRATTASRPTSWGGHGTQAVAHQRHPCEVKAAHPHPCSPRAQPRTPERSQTMSSCPSLPIASPTRQPRHSRAAGPDHSRRPAQPQQHSASRQQHP